MLGDTRTHRNRKDIFFRTRNHFRTRKVMAAINNDLKRVPPRLRDKTQIDIEKCIDNLHRVLLTHERVLGMTQFLLRMQIDDALVIVNHHIQPHVIHLSDLHDSLSNGSTPSSEQHDELPLLLQAENPPQEHPADAEEYVESEPDNYVPADLIKGKPEFRKYIDQIREELLTVFVPQMMVSPIEHFPSHRDLKLTFTRILRAARIYKKREIDDIIVSGFKCHVCEEIFKNFSVLKRHCKKEHEASAFVNCVCGKQLRARTAIIEHRRKHTGTSLYKCETCGKTFNRRSLMCLHMVSHMPKDEQPYVCCKCAKRFHTSSLLKKHEKVHLPEEERFLDVCNICQKKFTSKSAVNAHLRAVHYGEKPFVCEHCGNSFSSKAILTDHLTTHSEYAPWPCEVCGRNFKSKYRLNVHMDMHRTVKYRCPHCPMELSTRRTLRMHLLVHKEEKAYVCKVCSKAFRRSKDLKNHNNLHTGRRPYKCDFCERTFANGSNCRAHKLRMHPAELGVEKNCRSYSCKPKIASTSNTNSGNVIITTNGANVSQPVATSHDTGETTVPTETEKKLSVVEYAKYEFPAVSQDLDYSLEYGRYASPLNLNVKKPTFVQQTPVNQLASYSGDMHSDISKMHFLYS